MGSPIQRCRSPSSGSSIGHHRDYPRGRSRSRSPALSEAAGLGSSFIGDPRGPGIAQGAPPCGSACDELDGLRVSLQGLVGAPELNGRTGVCGQLDQVKGRVTVVLDGDGRSVAVRPACLAAMEDAGPKDAKAGTSMPPRAPSSEAEPGAGVGAPMSEQIRTEPVPGGLFQANLARLRVKADLEASGERPWLRDPRRDRQNGWSHSGGKGSGPGYAHSSGQQCRGQQGQGAAAWAPINFVAEVEAPSWAKRSVFVVKSRGAPASDSEGESEKLPDIPGRIIPPVRRTSKAEGQASRQRSPPPAALAVSAGNVAQLQSTQRPESPPFTPVTPVAPVAPVTPVAPVVSDVSDVPVALVATGNLTLVVSGPCHEENQEKKRRLQESKKQMLEKLTRQLQLCLSRLQDSSLSEQSREKYEDMIASVKGQITKISGIR